MEALMEEQEPIADKKTLVTAAIALVTGMVFSLMFQGTLPFQQRAEAANQFDILTQKISEDHIEITALREKMDNFQMQANSGALDVQKNLDDIKVELASIQAQLDDMKKGDPPPMPPKHK
jgi:hypothetical protein